MTPDDITDDDLLGGPTITAPEPNLPDSLPREKMAAMRNAAIGRCYIESNRLLMPVPRSFLADIFQMKQDTVKRRLMHCPTIGKAAQRDLYDFKEAVAYLIPPKMDVEQYIRSLDVAKLPNHINKIFWEALRQRLRYMTEAGEAWMTEDVLDVLGLVGMTIKNRLQLWTETMRERGRMSDEQMNLLSGMVEDLQNDLYGQLVGIARSGTTVPVSDKPIGAINEESE